MAMVRSSISASENPTTEPRAPAARLATTMYSSLAGSFSSVIWCAVSLIRVSLLSLAGALERQSR